MAEVTRKAECQSYVSMGGDTLRADLGSESYVIIATEKRGVDISFRSRMVTVYDDEGGWILRQIGKGSGKGFTLEKYSEFEVKTSVKSKRE